MVVRKLSIYTYSENAYALQILTMFVFGTSMIVLRIMVCSRACRAFIGIPLHMVDCIPMLK